MQIKNGEKQKETKKTKLPHFPTNQEKIDKYLDQDKYIYIFARVNPAPFVSHRQEETIGKWEPISDTGGRRYLIAVSVKSKISTNEYIELMDDIHTLMSAYFLTDFQPRDLVDFKVVTNYKNQKKAIQAILVFGQSNFVEFPYHDDIGEESLSLSDRIRSLGINPAKLIKLSADYPWKELKNNYKYLKTHPQFLKQIMLVRESFMLINQSFSISTYVRENELIIGIVLLVSALENLLLGKSNNEIKFKFGLIASILYEKNVRDEDFGGKTSIFNTKKLTFSEANKLFGKLYDIRSDIAHGTLNTIEKSKNKYWCELGELLGIKLNTTQDFASRMKNYALILTLIQHHVVLLLKNSLEELGKSTDEMLDFITIQKQVVNNGKTDKVNKDSSQKI